MATRISKLSSIYYKDEIIIDGVTYTSSTGFTGKLSTSSTITLTCSDGYSFNPNNPITPTINLTKGITRIAYPAGSYVTDYSYSNYSLNADYTQITFSVTDSNFIAYLNTNSSSYLWYPVYYISYCQPTLAKTTTKYTITQNLTGVTTDITQTTVEEGSSLTGTFVLKTGYENLSYSVVMGDETITGTNTTFTIDSVSDDIVITAYATKKVLTVTNELTKCEITSGIIPSSIDYGEGFFFEIKPITGYSKIVTAYYLNDIGDKSNITINSSGYVSTTLTVTENIHIFISAVQTFSITENLTNIISHDANPKNVFENETFSLTYTSSDGYLIDTLTSNIGSVSINTDKLQATVTGIATKDIIIAGEGKKIYKVLITGTVGNAICNYSDGDIVDTNKPLTITANDGYEFLSNYTYKYGTLTEIFSKNDDNTILTCELLDGANYTFNSEYVATKKTEKIGSFCNLYNVTNDELTSLSKKRFITTEGVTVDYGQYITHLYILPFTISNSYKGEKSSIILGNYDSTVSSTLFNTYLIEIDGGTISIPKKYNNVYDYLDVSCILVLPFFGRLDIPTDYVIDNTLSIKFIIDLYTGICTVNVTSTFNNNIIESQSLNIVTEIPFIQLQNNNIINNLSAVFMANVDTPQVEITRNIPYYSENPYGKETIDYDYLFNVTGFCKVSEINITSQVATTDELNTIINLLRDGVFINEN